MSKKQLFLVKIISVFSISMILFSCKQLQSNLSDKADSANRKTGMFLPETSQFSGPYIAENSRISDPKILAARMGIKLNTTETYRVSTLADGESILLVEKQGMLPEPLMSLKANGTRLKWSFIFFQPKDGKPINAHLYIKHGLDDKPIPYVSDDGLSTNMYLRHIIYNSSNVMEPVLVSWLNHLKTEDASGRTMFRVGNTIYDTFANIPIIEYRGIGNQVWEVAGTFQSDDISPGSLIWTADSVNYFSISPSKRKIVHWKKQDQDSMDRFSDATIESANPPKFVMDALQIREKAGFGLANKAIAITGPGWLKPDLNVIPLYQTKASFRISNQVVSQPASLGLADASQNEPGEPAYFKKLKEIGAIVGDEEAQSFGLDDPSPGSIFINNENNGGKLRVKHVNSENVLYPRGTVSSYWSGQSDYVGKKSVYELVSRQGDSSGHYIVENVVPPMGLSSGRTEQRWVPASQLRVEYEVASEAKSDQMRMLNSRIYENMENSRDLGTSADNFTREAENRLKELPGRAIAAGTFAGVNPQNLNSGQEAGVAMLREYSGQKINNTIYGEDQINASNIVASGAGTLLGNVAGGYIPSIKGFESSSMLGGKVMNSIVRGGVSKTVSQSVDQGVKQVGSYASGGDGINKEQVLLAIGDTAIDGTVANFNRFQPNPLLRAGVAVVGEEAKIATAEVGSAVQSGRQMYTNGTANSQMSSALNLEANDRQGKTVISYMESNNSVADAE